MAIPLFTTPTAVAFTSVSKSSKPLKPPAFIVPPFKSRDETDRLESKVLSLCVIT